MEYLTIMGKNEPIEMFRRMYRNGMKPRNMDGGRLCYYSITWVFSLRFKNRVCLRKSHDRKEPFDREVFSLLAIIFQAAWGIAHTYSKGCWMISPSLIYSMSISLRRRAQWDGCVCLNDDNPVTFVAAECVTLEKFPKFDRNWVVDIELKYLTTIRFFSSIVNLLHSLTFLASF